MIVCMHVANSTSVSLYANRKQGGPNISKVCCLAVHSLLDEYYVSYSESFVKKLLISFVCFSIY